MNERNFDELGPVDLLVVEFPEGQQNFTGEIAEELVKLAEAGTIRVIDALILMKDADGNVDAMELSDAGDLGALASWRRSSRSCSPRTTWSTWRTRWTPEVSPVCWCTRTSGRRRSHPRPGARAAS